MAEISLLQSKLTALCRAGAINSAGSRKIKDCEILTTEIVEILNGLPHFTRLQGLVRGHFLCKTSLFWNQEADILNRVGLGLVLCGLPASCQYFPISTFSWPVLLILSKCLRFDLLEIICVAHFTHVERLKRCCRSCERLASCSSARSCGS